MSSLLFRYRKITVIVLLGIVILLIIFVIAAYPAKKDNVIIQKGEVANHTRVLLPTRIINTDFIFADTNTARWQKSEWQSFIFFYPKDFKLTDGSFTGSYFYLDVNGDQGKMIRIYGVTENMGTARLEEIINKRSKTTSEGLSSFKLEDQKILPDNIYVRTYVWSLGESTDYRTFEVVKQSGNNNVRIFQVMASKPDWENNIDVLNAIIQKVSF